MANNVLESNEYCVDRDEVLFLRSQHPLEWAIMHSIVRKRYPQRERSYMSHHNFITVFFSCSLLRYFLGFQLGLKSLKSMEHCWFHHSHKHSKSNRIVNYGSMLSNRPQTFSLPLIRQTNDEINLEMSFHIDQTLDAALNITVICVKNRTKCKFSFTSLIQCFKSSHHSSANMFGWMSNFNISLIVTHTVDFFLYINSLKIGVELVIAEMKYNQFFLSRTRNDEIVLAPFTDASATLRAL